MQLLAYKDVKSLPTRPYTIIDYIAATYLARGPNPVINYGKFCKLCDYALARVKEASAIPAKLMAGAKSVGEGGSQGTGEGKVVSALTGVPRAAD